MIKKILLCLCGLFAFTPFVLADFIGYNNVYEFDVGERTQVGNYAYKFDQYGNLSTDNGTIAGNFAYSLGSAYRYDYVATYGWINGQLYFYSPVSGGGETRIKQGFIQNFCSSSDGVVSCVEGSFDLTLEDIINSIGSIEKVYFTIGRTFNEYPAILCFYDGNNYYCTLANNSDGGAGNPTNSLGLELNSFQDYVNYDWGPSPFVGGKIEDGYDIDDQTYTYGEIVQGYEACGLEYGYCFGGFPITDIFEPDQTIEDFTGYQFGFGANIWTIYNLYSSTYTSKQFFAQMLQAYNNGQINRFKTEPKALIMFVQQYVSAKSRNQINVGFYDLWDYCNIKLGYNNLNDEYTGHNQTPKTCYNIHKTNNQNWGGFIFTGENALNLVVGTGGTGFRTAKDFFGTIGSVFQNGIGVVNTNYTGFLPGYIIAFLLAFILIRLLSH